MSVKETPQYLCGKLAEQTAALFRIVDETVEPLIHLRLQRIEATRLNLEASLDRYQRCMLEHDLTESIKAIEAAEADACERNGAGL